MQSARREQVVGAARGTASYIHARKGIRAATVGKIFVLKPEMLAPVCAPRTFVSHATTPSTSKSMEILLPSHSVPTHLRSNRGMRFVRVSSQKVPTMRTEAGPQSSPRWHITISNDDGYGIHDSRDGPLPHHLSACSKSGHEPP